MTTVVPRVLWMGEISGFTYRLVDMGAGAEPRVLLEQQQPPDAMGGTGWARIDVPLANVLTTAFLALVPNL